MQDADHLVFTIAGPPDAHGRKPFYYMAYADALDDSKLARNAQGFASVADFHNRRLGIVGQWVYLEPVRVAKDAIFDAHRMLPLVSGRALLEGGRGVSHLDAT
ncbi:hypothetical protein C8J57DRAFT_1719932 [Mycena rebaudengoi]|nr:hypothetical protein C8J57DRAFT_1719932 [Mycena rebaudengoi]